MKNCVYILLCSNDRYYIGSTIDLRKRFYQHAEGIVKATRNLRPVKLAFYQSYPTAKEARQIEYWLKRQKDKDFILRIIKEGKIKKTLS